MRHPVLALGVSALALVSTASAQHTTRWTAEVSPQNALPEYPRPQMVREQWLNLNGAWELAITSLDAEPPDQFDDEILVPYPVESRLSGVQRRITPEERLWYRRRFTVPASWTERVLLHFGAVDWEATVLVNGTALGTHRGGYDSFSMEITDQIRHGQDNEIVVSVRDPSDAGGQPVGKQRLRPGGIFYTPSSGIWQTVWLEPVPESYVAGFRLTPDIDGQRLLIEVDVGGSDTGLRLSAIAKSGDEVVGSVKAATAEGFEIPIPEPVLWWPEAPFLYDLELSLIDADGRTVDNLQSYFGMREIRVGPDQDSITRLLLNDRFIFQLGPLDQGFWPDGLHTAPTDAALLYDLEVMKQIGFNMVRKHVKVEPARWYSWCDRMGLLVWQDMPSAANRDAGERAQFERELQGVIQQLRNHPSIIGWVPFNEGWGQYDTARIVERIRQWDPTRLVDNASGWTDRGVGDVFDQHAYPGPAAPEPSETRAAVLGEFGGLGFNVPGHMWTKEGWGYELLQDQEGLASSYEDLYRKLLPFIADPGVSAAVYTQISDIETENNGLMTYDREILKIDATALAMAHRGRFPPSKRGVADIFVTDATFEFVDPPGDAQIRYTLDGSEPGPDSELYRGPIGLNGDIEVRAISVWTDGEISRPKSFRMRQVEPLAAHEESGAEQGIRISYFEGRWENLPESLGPEPDRVLRADGFGLEPIDQEENFGLRFEGWLTVPQTGVYTFYLRSDDGSRLRVAGQALIDNDGIHGMRERSGSVALAAGPHCIALDYFQRRGGRGLGLEYEGPGLGRQEIPASALSFERQQSDPLLEQLPADATNFIVVRDLLPRVESLLEAEVLRDVLARTGAMQREVLGTEVGSEQLQLQLGMIRGFIPTEVVMAAPPATMTSLLRAGEAGLNLFLLLQSLTVPDRDLETVARLQQSVRETLADIRPPDAVGWIRMRDERTAELLFDTVFEMARKSTEEAGLTFEHGDQSLTLRIRPLSLQGGALTTLLEQAGVDPEPHGPWELTATIERVGAQLRLRVGEPAAGPLPAALLGPLWRPGEPQLAFVHYDWRDGAAIVDRVIEQIYDAFLSELAEDAVIPLVQTLSFVERLQQVPIVGATAVELDRDLVVTTEEELFEDPDELDEPAPELVRCIDPEAGPFLLSALTLDLMLSFILEDFELSLMQRADQAGLYEEMWAMFERFGDAIEFIDGVDSAVFQPGVAIVARAAGFRSLRETLTGPERTWSRELPFAAVALVAEADNARAGRAFVDKLTGLIAAGAGVDPAEVWADTDLGLEVPARELRWQAWLPSIQLDADFRPHCFLVGSFLVLSTDVGLSRSLLGRMRGTERAEMPLVRPLSWTQLRGEHLAGLCGGLAAWIGEANARLGTPGSAQSANLAQLREAFRALQALARSVTMLESYDQIVGRKYRSIDALRLRR